MIGFLSPPPSLLVNTVKLAPGDMKHFKNQRFYKLGAAVQAGCLLQRRLAFNLERYTLWQGKRWPVVRDWVRGAPAG